MPETFNAPKAVLAEGLVGEGPLPADTVLALRGATGETGAWARRIATTLTARAAAILEGKDMTEYRALPADQPLADALMVLVRDVFAVYAMAHEAHWNVAGDDFAQYHDLFGEFYEDTYGSVDPLAENIRKLGSLAPCLVVEERGEYTSDPMILTARLLGMNDALLERIGQAFDVASAAGQQGIANFLAERQDAHQMWAWKLRSSLGIAEVGDSPAELVDDDEDELDEMMPVRAQDENDAVLVEARKRMSGAERITVDAQIRAAADGGMRIAGYAAMFNREATGLPFREAIAPGAFSRSLQSGESIYLLINHDMDALPLASTRSGTLRLTEDDIGLYMEADLDPNSARAVELYGCLERGIVEKMSFAFSINEGGETREDGVRVLRDLNLYEVSVVTWPAYDATEVGVREAADDSLALRRRQIAARLELLK